MSPHDALQKKKNVTKKKVYVHRFFFLLCPYSFFFISSAQSSLSQWLCSFEFTVLVKEFPVTSDSLFPLVVVTLRLVANSVVGHLHDS